MVGLYEESGPSVVTDETNELLGHRLRHKAVTQEGCSFNLVLVAERDTGMATQKAILAQLGVWQLPARVPETHPTLKPGIGALHLALETGALRGMADLLRVGKLMLER